MTKAERRLYKVVINPRAYAQIEERVKFLARTSINASLALRDTFVKEFSKLSSYPLRYPAYNSRYRKLVIKSRYIALYCVEHKSADNDFVYVDYIFDGRSEAHETYVK
ncbi:MAG: hypothetical protein LBL34_00845 [Clostridiales bacterium]|jgi:hypothetical protein|nr:hypothetical protein [Clostridiales bacterium]